jgi:hypothetical protein
MNGKPGAVLLRHTFPAREGWQLAPSSKFKSARFRI